MKVALFLCLLVAGSQASFLDSLKSSLSGVGDTFKNTFHQVTEQAKVVGSQLLETAKTQGTQLASQALQSLLMGTMNALSSQGSSSKRDLSSLVNHASQLQHVIDGLIHDKTGAVHNAFTAALDKLHELQHTNPQDLVHQVQNVLKNHHTLSEIFKHDLVEGTQNIISQFPSHSQKRDFNADLHQVLDHLKVNLEAVFGHQFGQVDQLIQNLGHNLIAHHSVAPEN